MSYLSIIACSDSKDSATTAEGVNGIIDRRIGENVDAETFVAVLTANPNILRRAPGAADAFRTALRHPPALALFNERRVKALERLRKADLEPKIKMFMLDLQLEKVDHSVAMCMDHFVGVYELLRKWGHPDEVAFVGLLHAIYGTEYNTIDLLDHDSPVDRARVRSLVGDTTERWVALYGLMTACHFVGRTHDAGRPVTDLDFFEPANVLSRTISPDDFHALAELQVANAYEPYAATGRIAELGIARKFTLLRDYLTDGAKGALDDVLRAFPSSTDTGCQ